ncbi:hypothetical protein OG978_45875 (plasmid) [Streptomyces sp. NBC_01591]|uniref:hypothetical protein n=1 Tax=Streptomyces sp. NBC_01591 TaxID=2975888 RepID=UPI002DD8C95B|nr:hypothetical protein [Streptomyces sp. NBC_01591]WSD74686.1 hypothetical protein OG978_45875 [Streptomyces sp. NBC_01591]
METLNLSQIGQRAGVGRAAVVNWRRRHPDFPEPVGGTDESPQFGAGEAEAWLRAHGKLATGLTTVSCPCGESGAAQSPLVQAEEAKRHRDIGAEVSALVGGHRALTEAPWYPSRPGDRLLLTLEATGHTLRTTELYEVTEGCEDGMELRLVDIAPEGAAGGWYAGPPELYGADPVETPWMEAGPDRLTITRNNVIVHQGRHALARPDTAEPRITTAAGPDGTVGWAVVQEREYTPAEMSALEQKIIARSAELATRHDQEQHQTEAEG